MAGDPPEHMAQTAQSAFREFGLPDADELVVKSRLIHLVAGEVCKRGLVQKAAGDLLNLDQPNVSALVDEKISHFSVEQLMTLVGRLGFNVSIHIEEPGFELRLPYGRAA